MSRGSISSGTAPGEPPGADPPDDAALMRAIAAGDATALSRLYDRHSPLVLASCVRALRDRHDAEDLVVDIFWEIWDRHDRYDASRSSPRTYLLNVARSRIIDRIRTRQARGAPAAAEVADEPGRSAARGGPIDDAVAHEERDRLREAMRQLTPDQRRAIELTYFDAMTNSELAERLGQPLGTVKSRIRQALIRLREVLNPGDP